MLSTFLNALPGDISQGLIWGIMAIGVFITYRVLDIADLTVDGVMCTGGAVCVVLMTQGVNPWLALLLSCGAGMAAGFVTGMLHTFCGIPAILSGILTQLALYSINLRILGGSNKAISVDKYPLLVSTRYVTTPGTPFYRHPIFVVALFTLALIAFLYWFFGTELGCSLRATGANPNMARAQGINTNAGKVLGLMISNGIVALCSALLAQYSGFSDINMGRGAIVIGLAAVIIGEVLFGKIFRNFGMRLLAVSFGAILYYVIYRMVLVLGLKTDDMKLISALIVALFLSIPYWKSRYFTKPAKKGGTVHAGA